MAEMKKGKVSTLTDGGKTATVAVTNAPGVVSCSLVVPFYLYKCLEIGMEVAFVEFEDCTGIVTARMDGEWNHELQGDVKVVQNFTADEVITSAVPSYNNHTHTGVHGETSEPH